MGSYPGLSSEPNVIVSVLLNGGRRAADRGRDGGSGGQRPEVRCFWLWDGLSQGWKPEARGGLLSRLQEETLSDPL